jgi:hypothetical protein
MEKTDDQNDMHSDFGEDDDGLSSRLSAAPKECTDAHMKQMDAMIAKMSDAAKKKEATSALIRGRSDRRKGEARLRKPFRTGFHLIATKERSNEMRNILLRLLLVAGFVGLPLALALGHEGHHAECNETAVNALKADIQAMGEGEAKNTAIKELEAAQQKKAKNDIEGCKSHIHSAMEAVEK